jgi:hypothetical protein
MWAPIVMKLRLGGWFVLLSVSGAGGMVAAQPAGQQPTGEVEQIIKRANELRKVGDDQGALPLLVQAYQMAPNARTAIHLGLVEWALGRWADADTHLTEGLRSAPPGDAFITKNRNTIVEALAAAKKRVGSLDIKGDPAGAEVLVNGTSVGHLPLPAPVRVNAGTADVEVRAGGFRSQLRTVTAQAQNVQSVVFRLVSASSPEPAGGGPGLRGSIPTMAPEPDSDLSASAGPPSPTWRWLRLGTTVAAAAAASVAAYGFISHETKVREFSGKTDRMNRGRCLIRNNTVVDADGNRAQSDCFQLRTSYLQAENVMHGALVATGVLAAGAVVLWLVGPSTSGATSAGAGSSWAVAVLPGHLAASSQLRF